MALATRKVPMNSVIPRPVAVTQSIPAPTGGWNARDSLGDMDPLDAPILDNWFPGTADCMMRLGSTQFVTGVGGQVESLMPYSSGTATKLFAARANGNIYETSTQGTAGTALVTGLTNGRFQFVNITTSAGSYLAAVNGANKANYYDGTTWHKDGDGAPYDVTGLDTSTASNINVHKGRIWYTKNQSLTAYYLATGALGGTATAFDLSSVAQLGGFLQAMATWTIDAGYGVDDLAVWITSKGEVIVYRGTDPSSSASWALVGIWQIGSPIGRRCFTKFAGDLLIICQDGLLPLSGALQSSRTNPRVALSNKIQYAMSNAISVYGANFGWEIDYFAKQNMIVVNVPVSEGSNQVQYVMNTITKSWCRFTGWQANTFAIFGDNLYFGGASGVVWRAWNTNADNSIAINADGLQAFNYYKMPGRQKRCSMVRPILNTNGVPSVSVGVATDYNTIDVTTPASVAAISYGVWDTSTWNNSLWGQDLQIQKNWQGANALGYSLAPRVKTQANGIEVHWISTDLVMEKGGVL